MDAPCGGVASGAPRTAFEAGSNTVLRWALTQNHNAEFRVAFSPGGDAGFDDWVLGSRPDVMGQFDYDQEIGLPECVCDDCTIQLLQYSSPTMLQGYYSCADIELTQPRGGDLPPCSEVGQSGGATSTGDPSGTSSGGDATTADTSGEPEGSGSSTQGEVTTSEPTGAAASSGSAETDGGSSPQSSGGGCTVHARQPAPRFSVLLLLMIACARRGDQRR